MKKVVIYTDGSCIDNPGKGGYGVVLIYKNHRKELSGGFRLTTNNRMEIWATIRALQELKEKCTVTLYTDSQYVVNSIMKGWAKKWQQNGWKRNKKEKAKNPDLWQQLLQLCQYHQVTFKWVKGHAGHQENERCDQLAFQATQSHDLQIDYNYEGSAKE